MKLNSIGNILLKIFACVFTIVSLYLLFINITSNYGRLFPMNKLIVVLGAIIILAILLILKHIFDRLDDKKLIKISILFGIILLILQTSLKPLSPLPKSIFVPKSFLFNFKLTILLYVSNNLLFKYIESFLGFAKSLAYSFLMSKIIPFNIIIYYFKYFIINFKFFV